MVTLLGLFSAAMSAIALAIMISFDRIMIGDVYRNRPDIAWFVSSTLGALFGLIATMLVIGAAFTVDFVSPTLFMDSISDSFSGDGPLMLVSGAINIQVMKYYFRLFIPESGEQTNETSIALWLSSAPIFVFIAILFIQNLNLESFDASGIGKANTSLIFGLLIFFCIASFALFEIYDVGVDERSQHRYREIALMLLCIVGYTLIISNTLRADNGSVERGLVLQIWYWIGFAAGARAYLNRSFRNEIRRSTRRLKKFAGAIVLIEVLGMLVYLFEYGALAVIDPTLTNLVIGGHVLLVFLISLLLSKLRTSLQNNEVRRFWLGGFRISANKLPLPSISVGKVIRLLASQVLLAFVIIYAYM